MNGLMAHAGADVVTRDMVFAIEPPEHTQSWKPVAYRDAVLQLHDTIDRVLGLEITHEEFALNKTGTQMFHVARCDYGNDESGLSLGLRQSYDKSLALGVVAGAQVFVCDNLCFTGSAFRIMRKNTTNVWDDFKDLIRTQVRCSLDAFNSMTVDIEALKAVPCNLRRGYAILGVLLGEGILKPQQATVAFGDWEKPRHEEFANRNLWGLYNAVTEGLKRGGAGSVIDRHVDAHHWFKAEMGRLAA